MFDVRNTATRAVCLALAGSVWAQPCELRWTEQFVSGEIAQGHVNALATFDDGKGEALYIGGSGYGGRSLLRWDRTGVSMLGEGVSGAVLALAVFDDGSGPGLYVAGNFTTAGGIEANRIARWDGRNWSALGSGLGDAVWALAVFDDGAGPALYAGGYFTSAGAVEAAHIARWDGRSWSALGSGLDGAATALASFDDGTGPALYAAGGFSTAGGIEANHIARWDGSEWADVGGGVAPGVRAALAVFDDGSGPALYFGGSFTSAGGMEANHIARWDGRKWSPLASGLDNTVRALAVFDDGGGPALFAAGYFTSAGGVEAIRIARWDGRSWSALGSGLDAGVLAIAVFDDGRDAGPALFAGGFFEQAGDVHSPSVARWDGRAWSSLDRGISGPGYRSVLALASCEDCAADLAGLYAAGYFTTAGGKPAGCIARWDGTEWLSLGGDLPGINGDFISALAFFDDGSGPMLYAGGYFLAIGGVEANRIARWDGSAWTQVGGGADGWVRALGLFDDGSGPALYVGGAFTSASGRPVARIARWDGRGWSPLGAGLGGGDVLVRAFAVFDDGKGPALYVGGHFETAGTIAATNIARWDGREWSPVGNGLPGTDPGTHDGVWALGVYDGGGGGGPALYAGGHIEIPQDDNDGVAGLARWDGAAWSAVEGWQTGMVYTFQVFADGAAGSPALYIGSSYNLAGGLESEALLRFDGLTWSLPAGGIEEPDGYAAVYALGLFDDGLGEGPSLFAGGSFDLAGDQSTRNVARLIGCASAVAGDQDGDADVDADDLEALIEAWGVCPDPPVACPADLDGDAAVSITDLLLLLAAWT